MYSKITKDQVSKVGKNPAYWISYCAPNKSRTTGPPESLSHLLTKLKFQTRY